MYIVYVHLNKHFCKCHLPVKAIITMYISFGSFIVPQSPPRTYIQLILLLPYDQISDTNPYIFISFTVKYHTASNHILKSD